MRILALSDEESPALWDYFTPGRLDEFDLIISCGDLKSDYLSFLVTMGKAPLLYVHGNHDEGYRRRPPEGCDCIDDGLVVYNGLRILGLGGCRWYHPGEHQYTEHQMARRIARLRGAIRRVGGVDLVVTHAPPRGLGDQPDPAHMGFQSLRELIEKYQPETLLHGHVHLRYDPTLPREHRLGNTKIINVSERYTLELPDRPFPEQDRKKVIWISRQPEPPMDF